MPTYAITGSSGYLGTRMTPFALPPGVLDFFRHPWVASGAKAERELGFVARATSRDCFAVVVGRRAEIVGAFRARLRGRGARAALR